ncbi:hypothetical protein HJC23_002304 [Cyclotella cryptica]|uniref:Uncharacterized protein n=1 Tax=Cyclotella cryptica TaxID=29204 RepID=A0ABD3QN94_9STRA|eukprot:CCRYP_004388-RA/>CCRYP_004388-RA protein AED:0.18 eAED:0.12 QI:0/-1/0/1/-1/1/1/0/203
MQTARNAVKKAAKAKLSGFAVSDNTPKNKKVVFKDHDEAVDDDFDVNGDLGKLDVDINDESAEDDDAVEGVKGSAARESTQRLREAERLFAKESTSKKKRTKKTKITKNFSNTPTSTNDAGSSASESEGNEDMLTDDFFNMVDSERTTKLQLSKQEKKKESLEEKKQLGRHTTFVVEDDHRIIDVPKKLGQNIEVVATMKRRS